MGHESYLIIPTPLSSPQAHACDVLFIPCSLSHQKNAPQHTTTHNTTQHNTPHTTPHIHTQHMNTHSPPPPPPPYDHTRHIDHLTLRKVQATEMTKDMKTHNSQFWLRNEQHWLQPNMTAVCPRWFEMLTTLTFGALRKNHFVSTAFETIAKTNNAKDRNKKKRCPRAVSNVS